MESFYLHATESELMRRLMEDPPLPLIDHLNAAVRVENAQAVGLLLSRTFCSLPEVYLKHVIESTKNVTVIEEALKACDYSIPGNVNTVLTTVDDTTVIEFLLTHEICVFNTQYDKSRCVKDAVKNFKNEKLKLLITYSAVNVHSIDLASGETILDLAYRFRNGEAVRLLHVFSLIVPHKLSQLRPKVMKFCIKNMTKSCNEKTEAKATIVRDYIAAPPDYVVQIGIAAKAFPSVSCPVALKKCVAGLQNSVRWSHLPG
jgi:hypothetical protein